MQWEIVILVIFFVIIWPLSFKIKFSFNVLRNNGELKIYLFFLPIYIQSLKIDNGFIAFVKNPKKVKKIKLSFKKSDIDKTKNNLAIILDSQILKKVCIKTCFGIKNNPFYTAIVTGIYNSIIGAFFSINTAKLNILEAKAKLKTYYNFTYLKTEIDIKVHCSLYELISLFIKIKSGVKINEFN